MDSPPLVDRPYRYFLQPHVEAGRKLLQALDDDGFPVSAAFWYRDEEESQPTLVVASPIVDKQGPRQAYRRIENVLRRPGDPELRSLSLSQISAMGTEDPFVTLIQRHVWVAPGAEDGSPWPGGSPVSSIRDIWVYRVPGEHPDQPAEAGLLARPSKPSTR
jgi:hypothetical protein